MDIVRVHVQFGLVFLSPYSEVCSWRLCQNVSGGRRVSRRTESDVNCHTGFCQSQIWGLSCSSLCDGSCCVRKTSCREDLLTNKFICKAGTKNSAGRRFRERVFVFWTEAGGVTETSRRGRNRVKTSRRVKWEQSGTWHQTDPSL